MGSCEQGVGISNEIGQGLIWRHSAKLKTETILVVRGEGKTYLWLRKWENKLRGWIMTPGVALWPSTEGRNFSLHHHLLQMCQGLPVNPDWAPFRNSVMLFLPTFSKKKAEIPCSFIAFSHSSAIGISGTWNRENPGRKR